MWREKKEDGKLSRLCLLKLHFHQQRPKTLRWITQDFVGSGGCSYTQLHCGTESPVVIVDRGREPNHTKLLTPSLLVRCAAQTDQKNKALKDDGKRPSAPEQGGRRTVEVEMDLVQDKLKVIILLDCSRGFHFYLRAEGFNIRNLEQEVVVKASPSDSSVLYVAHLVAASAALKPSTLK